MDEGESHGSGPPLFSPAPTNPLRRADVCTIDMLPVWFESMMGNWDDRYKEIVDDEYITLIRMSGEGSAASRSTLMRILPPITRTNMEEAEAFAIEAMEVARKEVDSVLVERMFLNMIYRKPNSNRYGMNHHVPRGKIVPIPTFQCQAIMSALIWLCQAQGETKFTDDESCIIEKAIQKVFDEYNSLTRTTAGDEEGNEDATPAFTKLTLPGCKRNNRHALSTIYVVIGELFKTQSLYNPFRNTSTHTTSWSGVAKDWCDKYLWQFVAPFEGFASIQYIESLLRGDPKRTKRLAYVRFGKIMPIRIETIGGNEYLAIHPQKDIPHAYFNAQSGHKEIHFYLVWEGGSYDNYNYIYKGFWACPNTDKTKPIKEQVLDLVWEDEHTPVQPVAGGNSLGSPMVFNKPQTPLARKTLQESTSTSSASGKVLHLPIPVWQMTSPEEMSQISTATGLKRKAEPEKPPPDHYQYERPKSPFPRGFATDTTRLSYGGIIHGRIRNWLRISKVKVKKLSMSDDDDSDRHLHQSLFHEAWVLIQKLLTFDKMTKQETKNFLVFFGTLLVANIALEEERLLSNFDQRTTRMTAIDIILSHRQMQTDCKGYLDRFGNLYQRFYVLCFLPALENLKEADHKYFKMHLVEPFKAQSWKVMKHKLKFNKNSEYGATFPDEIDADKEKVWKAGKRPRYLYRHQRKALFIMGYGYFGDRLPNEKPGSAKEMGPMYGEAVESEVESEDEDDDDDDNDNEDKVKGSSDKGSSDSDHSSDSSDSDDDGKK